MGRAARAEGWRQLVIGGTPWIVVYRLTQQEVWIERVKHAAEDWLENL